MKIYTAANFALYERVRAFNEDLRAAGHEVTHDWSVGAEFGADGRPKITFEANIPEAEQREHAERDRRGVVGAELVIFLFDEGDPLGAVLEVGIALGANAACEELHGFDYQPAEVWVLAPQRWTIFWSLPEVTVFADEHELRGALGMARLEQAA